MFKNNLILFSLLLLFFNNYSFAQNSQFTSIGIGIAPNSGVPITISRGWGDFLQFRRTQNAGRWNIHNGSLANNLEFYYTNSSGVNSFNSFVLQDDQKIRIGNVTTPGNYRLYVEGGILTEQVKVSLKSSSGWADYVFDNNYNLAPLSEVKSFIEINKHLPNIPSTATLEKEEGFELGKMTTLQQEKIEELFLYVIQLDEKIKKLEKENEELKTFIQNK
ncbi:MAG TPA: hypothetical protein PKC76_14525 [Saprospiraceae bacterium]|nr:hypothetical protein [Saprospiraceae bacterium]